MGTSCWPDKARKTINSLSPRRYDSCLRNWLLRADVEDGNRPGADPLTPTALTQLKSEEQQCLRSSGRRQTRWRVAGTSGDKALSPCHSAVMAWEWVAPTATGIVGVAGVFFTWLSGAQGRAHAELMVERSE